MSRNPKRLGVGATIVISLVILALIAASGYVFWLCFDLVNQDTGITTPTDSSVALPSATTEAVPAETEAETTTTSN